MFKITQNDLAKKTDAQLAALFQEVAKSINLVSPDVSGALAPPCVCEVQRRVSAP